MIIHTIYSYGGGEYLYYVFNFVAMLVSAGDQGISTNIIRMVSLIGAFWAVILMYGKNSITPGITWVLWFGLASFVIIGPKGTVTIKDPIAYGAIAKQVDNVPLLLVVGASSFSGIGHNITQTIEKTFIIPGSPSYFEYTKTGSLFGSKLMRKLHEIKIEDPVFNANLDRFVQQCVVYDAMIGRKYTLKNLRETKDIWGLVLTNASPVLGFLYKDDTHNEIVTCKDGAGFLNEKWNEVIKQAASIHGNRVFGHKKVGSAIGSGYTDISARQEFLSRLPQSYRMFSGIAEDGANILKQQMLIHALREAPAKKANQLGNSYAVAKATLQQRNAYQTAGLMAEESLVVMRAVFEALIYGSFIFVYILMFLPAGYKVLGYYFQAICWIQLWAPLYAILNFIMSLYGHYQTKGILGNIGLTRANSAALIDLHTDITALAGWLSLSVPYIAFMLINKGGVSAFVHLASHLGSALGGSVTGVAAEKTTGNIALGNYSQGNTSLQTMSAYKHNTNTDFQSGQFSHNLASGAVKVTNPEGSVYLAGSGRTVSAFSTDIVAGEHLGMQLNQHAQREKALMESKGAEYSAQVASTQRDVAELMGRLTNSKNNSLSYAKDKTFSNSQALQNAMDFSKKLQDQFKISSQNSIDFALGLPIGASVKSSTGVTIAMEQLEDYAKSEGYKENFDSIIRASQNLNFDDRQTDEKALVQQINSSYEKSNAFRESMATHQQNAERLGRAATLIKSSNYDTRTVMTQDFLNYVANSKGINSQGRIGYDTAASIVDATNGPLAERKQEFLHSFQETKMQRAIDYFTKHEIKDGVDLDNAFNAINGKIIADKPELNHTAVMDRADEVKFDDHQRNELVAEFNDKTTTFASKKAAFEQGKPLIILSEANGRMSADKTNEGIILENNEYNPKFLEISKNLEAKLKRRKEEEQQNETR